MRPDVANRSGPHEEAVAIELNPTPVVVVMKAALDRVALADEILAKDVCDVNVLMARVETVEAAVRVLLQHREICAIELVTIVIKRAEHARAEIVIGDRKSTRLNSSHVEISYAVFCLKKK